MSCQKLRFKKLGLETIMLILDGTIGSDISAFLQRLQEETLPCKIILYAQWFADQSSYSHDHCNNHETHHPDGIVYLRVSPEVAFARIQKRALSSEAGITLEHIQQDYQQKNTLFIDNQNSPSQLQSLPVLVLNGNVDFQTDFAQFYNHLFYIKRLLNQIQDKKDLANGTYKEKAPHRHCC